MDQTPIARLTREQIDRLGTIFLPLAVTARKEAYSRNGNKLPYARFAHYTSAAAALKILSAKRLWLRNSVCMSDYREVQHGHDILFNYFKDLERGKAFHDAVEFVAPGAVKRAFDFYGKSFNATKLATFIACLSVHAESEDYLGRLSMWRAYGGAESRVAIVLKVPAETKSKTGVPNFLFFSPVSYMGETAAHATLSEVVNNVRANPDFLKSINSDGIGDWIFHMLLNMATCTKHEGFTEEKEWRVLYHPTLWRSDEIESGIEVVHGVPQVVHKVPLDSTADSQLTDANLLDSFDRVIIGPSQFGTAMYEAFFRVLTDLKIPDPGTKIFLSHIPMRT